MLDGIGKKNNKIRPVSATQLEQALNKKQSSAKLINDFTKGRTKIITLKEKSEFCDLKIVKPKKRKLGWYYIFAANALFILVWLSLSETYLFQGLKLLYLLKNETYLVGFQNSAELRATGGFWGSFALWRVGKNITQTSLLFETNPYKNDNPLLKSTSVELPGPMKEVWRDRPQSFVNANWFFDFRQSAKVLQWYFGQGWQMQSDGVIAISSLAMIDLLRLTGPIEIQGENISSDNFTQFMSQKIDTEYWRNEENIKTNEPKTIIKELFPKVLEKLKMVPSRKLFYFALQQGEKGRILMYFNDSKKQALVEKLNLSGKVIDAPLDYLSINNSNLSGHKSSLNIQQKIRYSVNDENIAALELNRAWTGGTWPNTKNQNYTRVIVPLGSNLVSATLDGQDITSEVETNEESGKTTFGFWFSVAHGEKLTAKLYYRLPFDKNITPYNLTIQKQPGTLTDELEVTFQNKNLFRGTLDKTSLYLP